MTDSPNSPTPADSARRFLLDSRRRTVERVLDCADAVAETWDAETTADPGAVADPLRAALDAAGVWPRLPDLLVGAVRATGRSLSASPVAAPPYVAATSRGPVLRASLSDGRLVVLLRAFKIDRASPGRAQYARGPATPEGAVHVEFV